MTVDNLKTVHPVDTNMQSRQNRTQENTALLYFTLGLIKQKNTKGETECQYSNVGTYSRSNLLIENTKEKADGQLSKFNKKDTRVEKKVSNILQ